MGADHDVIVCKEYGPIKVDPDQVLGSNGRLNLASGVLNKYVKADFVREELRLSAMGITGLIPLTDRITIQVRPRFPLQNLTHMVSVCGHTPTVLAALREYTANDQWNDWLLDVMADGLLAAFDTIRLNGLLRSYRYRTDVSSYPHGRIDTNVTILRYASRGINHRAQHSWFERTIDNSPNRCLKLAIAFLHSRYLHFPRRQGDRERISRLGEAMRVLHEVALESSPVSLEDPQVRGTQPLPETRTYYRPALELAVAILTRRGISLDAHTGSVSMPSLLVKTEDLFEEFVRLSLQNSLSNHPNLSVLDGNQKSGQLPLYEDVSESIKRKLPDHEVPTMSGGGPSTKPDLLFRMRNGEHPLVADVKYTSVDNFTNRSEVEQVILYGLRYRSPIVMTVHPLQKNTKGGLHIIGQIGSILVTQYRVDLGADDLETEMGNMANRISELIASQITSDPLAPA